MAHSHKSPSQPPRGTRKQQKLVRIPHELAERVLEASQQLGISGNEFHVRALATHLQTLRASAPERDKDDDAQTEMAAQYRIAEALGETVRGVLNAEVGHAVDALAPRIARDVTTALTSLRSEIAGALSSGLRTIQGQVEHLIADSILSGATPRSHELGYSLEPSALRAGVRTTEQLNLTESRKDKLSGNVGAQQDAGQIDNQQSLAAFARRVQARGPEPRPSSVATRGFRKSGG